MLLPWLPAGWGQGLRTLPIHQASAGLACLLNGSTDGWLQGKEKKRKAEREGRREAWRIRQAKFRDMTSWEVEIKGEEDKGEMLME